MEQFKNQHIYNIYKISLTSPVSSHWVISKMVQELFERERCLNNSIAQGVHGSSFISISEKISNDEMVIGNIHISHWNAVPSNLKLVRLGKARPAQ